MESITLNDNPFPTVNVSISVVFNILNAFNRRNEGATRIVGALLGESKDHVVNVTECFIVPFTENVDKMTVEINESYYAAMANFHFRNNKREQVVGWFSTSTSTGALVTDNCALVHEFFAKKSTLSQVVHLVVDTTLASADALMSVRAFIGRDNRLDEESLSVGFHEVKTFVVPGSDAEATLVHQLLRGQNKEQKFTSATVTAPLSNPSISPSETGHQQVRKSLQALIEVIEGLQTYVDMVQEGKIDANREVGMMIHEAIALYGAQPLQPAQVAALQTRAQDLLMVAYLASSAHLQTTLAEKVNQIL